MKKLLSVFLAVLMLFGALSISGSAAYVGDQGTAIAKMHTLTGNSGKNVVIEYNLNGGSTMNAERVYDLDKNDFAWIAGLTGTYYSIPETANDLFYGQQISLPSVVPPANLAFVGWFCEGDGQTYVPGAMGKFNVSTDKLENVNYPIVKLTAVYAPAAAEEDTMGKIMGILTKVFGAIIGLLFYAGDTAAGVKIMEQILGGLSL